MHDRREGVVWCFVAWGWSWRCFLPFFPFLCRLTPTEEREAQISHRFVPKLEFHVLIVHVVSSSHAGGGKKGWHIFLVLSAYIYIYWGVGDGGGPVLSLLSPLRIRSTQSGSLFAIFGP